MSDNQTTTQAQLQANAKDKPKAAPEGFKLERRSKLHVEREARKAEGFKKVEITHGMYVCGEGEMDKDTRSRIKEDIAHVGDHVTLPADEAHALVMSKVAKYVAD